MKVDRLSDMSENEASSTSEWLKFVYACIGLVILVAAIQSWSWVQAWVQDRKACAEWREYFPDRRLMEIVRKDVNGQTLDQIGDFYGVSGRCIEKRVSEDRELFDRLKAEYISRSF
ncbi:MAG: hypothetical protein OXN17_12330 [Candidatus Poribacteria bacterium]|nr:hypothetical protein [Candidatus Poribacteria bacterium]MDE0506925.1 hypothetical protein [Candidatus Poribacteria bacterium]